MQNALKPWTLNAQSKCMWYLNHQKNSNNNDNFRMQEELKMQGTLKQKREEAEKKVYVYCI